MNETSQIAHRVKKVIVKSLELDIEPHEIADDESLFEGIGADSIAALEIVFALEEEFGIDVDDEDLRVELFDSVAAMSRYIADVLVDKQS